MQPILVRGEGPLAAKIAIIGEAPGEQEELTGRPFVGPAGEVLNTVLQTAQINRSDIYITNVVKERPPDNNISKFITFNKNGTITTTPAYDMYEKALWTELSMTNATVLIPLGNVSLYALTRKTKVLKRRGSILSTDFVNRMNVDRSPLPRKVIPTIHPSAALQGSFLLTHLIAHDLERAREESEYPDLRLPIRHIIVEPSYIQSVGFLNGIIQRKGMVAFDIEVMREEVSCISFATSPSEVISIPFTKSGRDYFNPEHEVDIIQLIACILEDKDIKKVGHNIFFDASFMYEKYGICTTNMDDTMVATKVLYPDFSMGLDFVTTEFTREPYYKDDGKKYMKLNMDEKDFWIYNAKDSAVCLEAFPKIIAELEKFSNTKAYYRQVALLEPLLFMYARGIAVDREGIKAAIAESLHKTSLYQEQLDRLAGEALNANSTTQLRNYFYVKKGLEPYTKWTVVNGVKIKSTTTDETAMIRIARKGFVEARLVLDIRGEVKNRGTYLEIELDDDGRLRSSMNAAGSKNGRLSSSKTIFGTGMNVQNLPHEFRDYLIADPGYVGYEIDLSQAENRLVAYLAPEQSMIEAFERGRDLHSLTAGLIFGKDPAQVSDEEGSSSLGSGKYSERFWGKKANHALNYGMGYKKFSLLNELPENEGKMIVDRYHRVYPGVRGQYQNGVKSTLHKKRMLVNPLGRVRIFLDQWGDDLYQDAYAFTPQSTVADIINEYGLLRMYSDQEVFWAVEILNQVHDSIWFQIPLSESTPWAYHANAISVLKHSLEIPLTLHGTTFVIPADLTMGFTFNSKGKNMSKVKISADDTVDIIAAKLEETYNCLASKRTGLKVG